MTELATGPVQRPLLLSALEFDVLWEHLGLGPLPLVLKVPSPGRTHSERAAIAEQVWTGLHARDLGGPLNPHPGMVDMLRVLAEPDREVDTRLWLGRRIRALAAAADTEAVVAVLDGDVLALRHTTPASLVREVVGLLPPVPAGSGHSVTLPSADLDDAAAAAGDSVNRLAHELRVRGVRAEDADTLAVMVRDAGHRGQFGAAGRERWGRRVRADRAIGFFDTPRGRYLQVRTESGTGDSWSTVSPTDARRLTSQLDALT